MADENRAYVVRPRDQAGGDGAAPSPGGAAPSAHHETAPLPPGWSRPKPDPEDIPRPTYWPAVLAAGITALLWGTITSWIISLVGLVLFAIALWGWIEELRHGDE